MKRDDNDDDDDDNVCRGSMEIKYGHSWCLINDSPEVQKAVQGPVGIRGRAWGQSRSV